MIVRISDQAERDLELIGDYIADDDALRAASFVRELRDKCIDIGGSPRLYPLVARYDARGLRKRVHCSYLILYEIDDGVVSIARVVHGARDWLELI